MLAERSFDVDTAARGEPCELLVALCHKSGERGFEPQSPLSHRGLTAQPPDGQSTSTVFEATHLKNLHIGLVTPTESTEGAQGPREEPFTRDEGEEPERATERRSWRRMLDAVLLN